MNIKQPRKKRTMQSREKADGGESLAVIDTKY